MAPVAVIARPSPTQSASSRTRATSLVESSPAHSFSADGTVTEVGRSSRAVISGDSAASPAAFVVEPPTDRAVGDALTPFVRHRVVPLHEVGDCVRIAQVDALVERQL